MLTWASKNIISTNRTKAEQIYGANSISFKFCSFRKFSWNLWSDEISYLGPFRCYAQCNAMHLINILANSAQPSGKFDLAMVHTIVAPAIHCIRRSEKEKKNATFTERHFCSALQFTMGFDGHRPWLEITTIVAGKFQNKYFLRDMVDKIFVCWRLKKAQSNLIWRKVSTRCHVSNAMLLMFSTP